VFDLFVDLHNVAPTVGHKEPPMSTPLLVRRMLSRRFRLRGHGWQWFTFFSCSINLILGIWLASYLLDSSCNSLTDSAQTDLGPIPTPAFTSSAAANVARPVSSNVATLLQKLVTVVILEFEQFEHDLEDTLNDLCTQIPNVNVLLVSNVRPYPPLRLPSNHRCAVRLVVTDPDVRDQLFDARPEHQITTKYVLFVPDGTRISSQMLLSSLKVSQLRANRALAIPIMHLNEAIDFQYDCLLIHLDRARWTLRFEERLHEHGECEALSGEFAFLLHSRDLLQFALPFERPLQMSLYLQAKLHRIRITLDEDIKFYRNRLLFATNERNRVKADQLNRARLSALFRRFGVKKLIESNGDIQWFGCNKHTPRCFTSIVHDTPDYLYDQRWTPPCCLAHLRQLAAHVFNVLEACNVRYWLEGGTLLGALRSGDIIPWDYDVDVGIYREDIVRCPILNLSLSSAVKDEHDYVWEKAREGDFLRVNYSPINRLHVDLFPFYARHDMMTKSTWFPDHVQDKEFPEHFLKPLERIKFLGRLVSVPNNARDFVEYKFGAGVIENPQYPRPELIAFDRNISAIHF
jgi:hypothetical protein